jgi:type I restriction enzyme S subunit
MVGRSGVIGGAIYVAGPYWPLNTTLFVRDFGGNEPRWVYYLLKSIDFSGYNSGSAQPSLNRNYIAHIPVLVPPPDEQRAIAATLGALDDKIESNKRQIALMEELASANFTRFQMRGAGAEDDCR